MQLPVYHAVATAAQLTGFYWYLIKGSEHWVFLLIFNKEKVIGLLWLWKMRVNKLLGKEAQSGSIVTLDPFIKRRVQNFCFKLCLSVGLSACQNIFYKCVECLINQSQAQSFILPLAMIVLQNILYRLFSNRWHTTEVITKLSHG